MVVYIGSRNADARGVALNKLDNLDHGEWKVCRMVMEKLTRDI